VLEEFGYFLFGLRFHLHEDLLGVIVGEIAEQVGGGVGVHFLDDFGGTLGVERFDDRLLNLGLYFFERFGGHVLIKGAEDGFALVRGEVFDDVGDVGGVQLGQTLVRNLELDAARGISLDEIDEGPGNGAGRNFLDQDFQRGAGRESAQQAADGPAGADVDGLNAQDGMGMAVAGYGLDLQIDIVDAMTCWSSRSRSRRKRPSAPLAAAQSAKFDEA